jgi:hypothetical protein
MLSVEHLRAMEPKNLGEKESLVLGHPLLTPRGKNWSWWPRDRDPRDKDLQGRQVLSCQPRVWKATPSLQTSCGHSSDREDPTRPLAYP